MTFSSHPKQEGYKQINDNEDCEEIICRTADLANSEKEFSPRQKSIVYLAIGLLGVFVGYLAGQSYSLLPQISSLEALEGQRK